MNEGGDGLEAVHDRQESGQDEDREDAGIDGEAARFFVGEIAITDFEEGGLLKAGRAAAAAEEAGRLITLLALREALSPTRVARVGVNPAMGDVAVRCGFHILTCCFL